MYTDVCQKPTKFCKAIIWQLKNKLLKKIIKVEERNFPGSLVVKTQCFPRR